jgi:hypothetical protein
MSQNKIFNFNIPDGHSFNGIIKVLKTVAAPCSFILRQNQMTMQIDPRKDSDSNEDEGLVLVVEINTVELLEYTIDMNLVNDPKNKCHVIFLNSSVLKDQIGSVTKKHGIRMYQYVDDPKVHIESYVSGMCNRGSINTEHKSASDRTEFDLSDFKRSLKNPNCRIVLHDFVDSIKRITRIKITKAYVKVTEDSLRISATSNSNTSDKYAIWPEGTMDDEEDAITELFIRKNVISVFTHLQGLSSGGTIRVYAEEGTNVIRFVSKVGHFGELFIYVFSPLC